MAKFDSYRRKTLLAGGTLLFAGCSSVQGILGGLQSCENTLRDNGNLDTKRVTSLSDYSKTEQCKVLADGTEGPYFKCEDKQIFRRNISKDREGNPMAVGLRIVNAKCEAVENAYVDIWHCDGRGDYSLFGSQSSNPNPFCRGVMKTDKNGIVEFDTIVPGWYAGRASHIHFKVHQGNTHYLTNQALLPEEFVAPIYQSDAPYSEPRSATRTTQKADRLGVSSIFSMIKKEGNPVAILTLVI